MALIEKDEEKLQVTAESDEFTEYCMKIGRRIETGQTPVEKNKDNEMVRT